MNNSLIVKTKPPEKGIYQYLISDLDAVQNPNPFLGLLRMANALGLDGKAITRIDSCREEAAHSNTYYLHWEKNK